MKKFFILAVLSVLLCSCTNEVKPKENVKKEDNVKFLMSPNTELRETSSDKFTVSIPSVKCSMCEKTIREAFEKHMGIVNIAVNLESKTADIEYNSQVTSQDKIKRIIAETGYNVDDLKRNEEAYKHLPDCCK